ncbi:Pectate lyase superfamily protein [Anaerohalosphaera lusitana]|uniref:Pectate lyase superfamily protein n=1 Tax=Anaerohalosphaera lusitana TaxID=1936003 RepID=A0A1U9NJV8_9BACT|nr:glycosyl hydrolase family 28-related protein [Anaerohalosphaera lusitana]AQT68105.1 Pectate lyase superfamily protein [Anaerohalosphaera lusitana]
MNIFCKKCFVFFLFFSLCFALYAQSYEAEDAVLNQVLPKVDPGASGGYRVAYFDNIGDYIRFDDVTAGDQLVITYSLGLSESKQCSLYCDNVDVATAVFHPTGSWDTYSQLGISASAESTVMLRVDADDELANSYYSSASIDKIELSSTYWRSSLYPENWTPGYKDSQGRFLHDFSYAGYRKGQADLGQAIPSTIIDVTKPPYNADNTGNKDSTNAIQAAIDYAASVGGAVVYLPAGKYTVSPQNNDNYAIRVSSSNIVLRGDGPENTKIFNNETYMRSKSVILFAPAYGYSAWFTPVADSEIAITADIPGPTNTIQVASTSGLNAGDWIIVRTDCTEDFIADHNMSGIWTSSLKGTALYRRITGVNPIAKTITIDIPTRYWMKTRDNARVYKIPDHIEEVGIEHLSIGMLENPNDGLGDGDYAVEGTAAYEVHSSEVITFANIVDGWISDIQTYRPEENTGDYHVLSNIILLEKSRNITVRGCSLAKPQYEGGGGNGYAYILSGNDCLLVDCKAYHTRHNYSFKSMWTCGNVLYRCESKDPRLTADFHMHLSPANLIDSNRMDNDTWNAKYRPYGTIIHGHTTSQTVFWNTYGEGGKSYLIDSKQWDMGYVIGTSGTVDNVILGNSYGSEPEDFLEGEGLGETLEPQSLFVDQLTRRNGDVPSYLRTLTADFNNDGVFDMVDMSYFFEHWLDCGLVPHCN